MLTNETPTFATIGSAPRGNDTYAPTVCPAAEVLPGLSVSVQVPAEENGRANVRAK